MRLFKSSERRLALIFGILIFLAANFFALGELSRKRDEITERILKLQVEKNEARLWLAQGDLWLKRKAWLDEKQPRLKGGGQESADFLQVLQQSAHEQKIVLGERSIIEPSTGLYFREVAIRIQAKGSLESVTRWLFSLQSPEGFQAITSFTLVKDIETSDITCALTIARWYRLP